MSTLRHPGSVYWALDTRAGKHILITPENRLLYRDSTRYVKVKAMQPPAETQDIFKIMEAQEAEGIKRGDFDEEDVEMAKEGMKTRRFVIQKQNKDRQRAAEAAAKAEQRVEVPNSYADLDGEKKPTPKRKQAKKKA